jgi:diphosphomevalonate decarboxylase
MAIAHPNLAFIKYWGKKDIENNIPANDSISISLNMLQSTTTIEKSNEDQFFLNGIQYDVKPRMQKVLQVFRDRVGSSQKLKIISENNFPHGCGMASSASGFAALVLSLNEFFGSQLTKEELSIYARIGSGSASRSIFDGIVLFKTDRSAKIADWDELVVLSINICSNVKEISSTAGMILTAETSYLYQKRLEHVDEKIAAMIESIEKRHFPSLAEAIMRDSNEIHAICMDTYPPIRYINDEGFSIIKKVHDFNRSGVKVAYSFDAGTNPFLITLKDHYNEVKDYFKGFKLMKCN